MIVLPSNIGPATPYCECQSGFEPARQHGCHHSSSGGNPEHGARTGAQNGDHRARRSHKNGRGGGRLHQGSGGQAQGCRAFAEIAWPTLRSRSAVRGPTDPLDRPGDLGLQVRAVTGRRVGARVNSDDGTSSWLPVFRRRSLPRKSTCSTPRRCRNPENWKKPPKHRQDGFDIDSGSQEGSR